MTIRRLTLAAMCATYATAAPAAPVVIDVRAPDGKALPGAVVAVDVSGVPAPKPRGTYTVEQRNIQFQPHVLIVPVGAAVVFPNRDKVRHHVYSFSKPKKFDLKLYGREEARSVTFDKPGVVALGCNIHDAMSGFVYVAATPFAVQTNGAGRAALQGVPPGDVTIRIWHPSIRAPGNTVVQRARVAPAGLATVVSAR